MKCLSSLGLASFAEIFVTVLDINDNPPELTANDIFVCENDVRNTVRGEHFKYLLVTFRFRFSENRHLHLTQFHVLYLVFCMT